MQRRIKRPVLLGLFGLFSLGLVTVWTFWPRSRVNVILITLDTTRADHLGCYGYQRSRTPAMNALAKDGALFKRAYAPVPVTLPSHASMLTGLYPPEHGLHSNGRGRLGSSIPVLAEVLRAAHYETGAFVASFVLNSKFGLHRGFQHYDDQFAEAAASDDPGHQRRDGKYVIDNALAWMKSRQSKPFFCWIHLYDAHAAYDPRPGLFGTEFTENPYDAGIAYMDLQIQRLKDFLKREKLSNRTLIVVVGDHGEDLMEHQEAQHGSQIYDSTLRVPLIFSGTSAVKAGVSIQQPVSLVDLMPTLLECLNVPCTAPVTGRSLKAALAGDDIESRPCYAETDVPFLENRWAPLRGLVTDRWKYIETTRPELFDLVNDPNETHNLAETQPEAFQQIRDLYEEFTSRLVPREAGSINLTATEQRMLESLGYIGSRADDKRIEAAQSLPDVKDMLPFFNELAVARTLLRDGAAAQAIQKIRLVLEKAPNYVQARLLLGDALFAENQFAEAMAIYEAVVSEHAGNDDAEGRLANVLVAQGRLEDALPHYRKVIEESPMGGRFRIRFAQTLNQLRRKDEALSVLIEAIQENSQDLEAHLECGSTLMQMGRMKEAVPHLETILKFQPRQTMARLNLASALASTGQMDNAVTQVAKAVEIEPTSFEARFTFGAIRMNQNRPQEAIIQFEEACRLRPDDVSARTELNKAKSMVRFQRPQQRIP